MKPWIMMRKGIRFNQMLDQRMSLVVGSGILAGVLFHQQLNFLKPSISYIFAYITFAVSLNCSSKHLWNALRRPGNLLGILGLLHIVLPVFAYYIAHLLIPNNPLLQAGVMLITASPIGVASILWTNISGGNVPVALTSVVTDTLLSPLIVPFTMLLFVGKSVNFDVPQLIIGLALMVVIPTIIGMTAHDLTKGDIGRKWKFVTGPSTKILLSLIIAVNLAMAWESLDKVKSSLVFLLIIAFIMACIGYLMGFLAGKILRLPPAMHNTYIFNVGMRNNTASLALASYFNPITAVPVVCAILFQQPLAALSFKYLTKRDATDNPETVTIAK